MIRHHAFQCQTKLWNLDSKMLNLKKMIVPGHKNVSAILSELTQGKAVSIAAEIKRRAQMFQARNSLPKESIHRVSLRICTSNHVPRVGYG